MSAESTFGAVTRISNVVRELDAVGMRTVVGDDFTKYRSIRSVQPDRPPTYPMFDTARSYVDSSNGFWICGFDANDTLVHTQAVRLLDLADTSLADHLNVHRHKYITPDTTPDPDRTHYAGPEALKKISGRVCYHGDFWLQPSGLGGVRGMRLTGLVTRILFEVAQLIWKPDFIFALVAQPVAEKGAFLRAGYSHCEPGKWIGPDQQVTEEDYTIWMNANDIANAIAREPSIGGLRNSVSPIRSSLTSV